MRQICFVLALLSMLAPHLSSADSKESPKKVEEDGNWDTKYRALLKSRPDIRAKVERGDASKEDVIAWMKRGGEKNSKSKRYYEAIVEVKDPAGFQISQDKVLYSGPQAGERLPVLSVVGFRGENKGKTFDPVANAKGKPQILIFQDQSPVGVKGLFLFAPVLSRIAEQSKDGLDVTVVFLGDDPSSLSEEDMAYLLRSTDIYQMAYSNDGRDGPGAYGLDRNVAVTILVQRGGKVLHNFAFSTPMLYPDGHVVGALAEAIGKKRETVADWFRR